MYSEKRTKKTQDLLLEIEMETISGRSQGRTFASGNAFK